jgi:hypothetical protein
MRKNYEEEENKLEQALKPGQDKNTYRRELEKLGYQITSVNYDRPDYLEYEIVKGNNSYEVQSGKASKVDVAPNLWRTDATKAALRGKKSDYPEGTTANSERHSDRDRKAYDSEDIWQAEATDKALEQAQKR